VTSRAPDWIYIRIDHFYQIRSGLQSSRLDLYQNSLFSIKNQLKSASRAPGSIYIKIDHFQLRFNEGVASRAPGWIYIKIDHFSIENQIRSGLQSSRLDLYQN